MMDQLQFGLIQKIESNKYKLNAFSNQTNHMKLLLPIFALLCFQTFGQMNTDRPSYSMGAQTIRKGEFQIEAGLQLNNRGQNNPQENTFQAPTAVFRIGLADNFELRFQNGLNIRQGLGKLKASMENLEVGFKLNLLHRKKTNISTVLHGIAPTSSGKWQPREKGGRFVLVVDHKIKESGTIGCNLGSKFSATGDNDMSLQAYYSVYYSHNINSGLSLFVEAQQLFPTLEEFDIDGIELNADCGLTYALKKNLQLDYSFGFGLLQRMNFQSIGLTYKFEPDPKPRLY